MHSEESLFLIFSIYFLLVFIVGYVAKLKTKNLADYVLGGRRLSGPIVALGAGASDMSGWLLLALPGAVMTFGLKEIWLPIGLVVGAYLNWLFVAKRLRIATEKANDSLTIPTFLSNHFQDKTHLLSTISGIVIIIFFTIYCSSGFVAAATLGSSLFPISYSTALIISAVLLVGYTVLGGFLAISWLDFFQGILVFFALVMLPFFIFHHLHGIQPSFSIINKINANLLKPFHDFSLIGLVSLFAWSLGYFGQPHILVRFMAAKSANDIPLARRICMSWMSLSLMGATLVGLLGIAFFQGHPLVRNDLVFIKMGQALFNPFIAGIVISAVLSAIMSAISAQLLAMASVISEDCYHAFFRHRSQRSLVLISRVALVALALIALLIANEPSSTLLSLVGFAWAGLGSSFGPIILVSLFLKKVSKFAALAGVVTGGSVTIIWHLLAINHPLFAMVYEIIPAFSLSMLAIFLVQFVYARANAAKALF